MVDTLPPVHSVLAELMEQLEGENVHQFGWLLAFDEQINVWYPTFAVAFGSLHVRLFEGPRELLQYEIGHIHLSASIAVGGHISASTGDDEWNKRLFSIDDGKKTHSFCAATSGERQLWLSKLKESYEQVRETTLTFSISEQLFCCGCLGFICLKFKSNRNHLPVTELLSNYC